MRRRAKVPAAKKAEQDLILDARKAWAASRPQECMLTRQRPGKLDIHEILRRSQAPNYKSFHPCNLLLLSRAAHESELFAVSNRESLIKQLAIKKYRDPQNFDLHLWLRIRNERAMEYIEMSEIEEVDLTLLPGFVP